MQHIHVSRELRSLHAVLTEWVRLNGLLARQWSKSAKDLPWWYNERALLSVFVGAIWISGGKAFEEFSEKKRKGRRRRSSQGRVDLWFQTRGGEFLVEAKHAEIPITKRSGQQQSLETLLSRAVEDTRDNPADGTTKRIALTFAVPYFTAKASPARRRSQIDWFLKLIEDVDTDAVAWVFPKLQKLPESKGYVCPGIAVMIKRVRRSPR